MKIIFSENPLLKAGTQSNNYQRRIDCNNGNTPIPASELSAGRNPAENPILRPASANPIPHINSSPRVNYKSAVISHNP